MPYYIDIESITIDNYKIKLETAYLPPSRNILRERKEERFNCFKKRGIKNLKQLVQMLKKKEVQEELSHEECFQGDYLKILLRELNSLLPKPNKIKDFSGISTDIVKELEKIGIKNTLQLYNKVKNKNDRIEFSRLSGISDTYILELTKLTDLSRIRWVGVTAARMLVDIGFDTVEKVSLADPNELHEKINHFNKVNNIFKGHIGLNDIKILVETAKEVPKDIQY